MLMNTQEYASTLICPYSSPIYSRSSRRQTVAVYLRHQRLVHIRPGCGWNELLYMALAVAASIMLVAISLLKYPRRHSTQANPTRDDGIKMKPLTRE